MHVNYHLEHFHRNAVTAYLIGNQLLAINGASGPTISGFVLSSI